MSAIRSISAQLPAAGDEPQWFAFRTMYKRESMVERRLRAQEIEVYVPLITQVRHYKSKRKVLRVPLLSSYIFVRLSAKQYGPVLADPDVFEIVKFQGEVGRVTDEEIRFLKAVLRDDPEENYEPEVRQSLRIGSPVVVAGGALAGTKGYVLGQQSKHNFEVELQTLGISLVVTVRSDLLELDANATTRRTSR